MLPSQQQQTMGYDYAAMGSQGFQSQQQQQHQQHQQQQKPMGNGYVYNHSPLGANTMLNQQQQAYNNLNLSTRAQHNLSGIYPTPRVTSLSPSLNFTSLYSNRARFSAQKGFDIEDDLEFCPEIPQQYANANANFTHHRFNPYTSSTFSPTVSPTSQNAMTTSPLPKKASPEHPSPRGVTPRAKKVLDIVNPLTGMRVGSPASYK